MTTTPTSAGSSGLIDRVKNILLTPKAEWARIATEPADIGKLYIGYALPLLALAAICSFIGLAVIGLPFIGHLPLTWAVTQAALNVVMGLVTLFVAAFIANALAPTFGSKQDMGQAQKLIVYGSTAGILAGVIAIIPSLGMLAIVGGIYSIVLIYFGLPAVMGTPTDKQVVYTAVLIIACAVVFFVLAWVVTTIMFSLGFSALGAVSSMASPGLIPSPPK
jgi:hypothetical protein